LKRPIGNPLNERITYQLRICSAVQCSAVQCSAVHSGHLTAQAVLDDNRMVVRLLLLHGADPDRPDEDGWTALHAAAANGHHSIVRYGQCAVDTVLSTRRLAQ
jgi:hypothetical protein